MNLTKEDIDLSDPAIKERYAALIHSSPDWSADEKKRIVAIRENARIKHEADLKAQPTLESLTKRVSALEQKFQALLEATSE